MNDGSIKITVAQYQSMANELNTLRQELNARNAERCTWDHRVLAHQAEQKTLQTAVETLQIAVERAEAQIVMLRHQLADRALVAQLIPTDTIRLIDLGD